MFLPQEIIRRKRDGLVLSQDEIQSFVDGLSSGAFTDAQVGAMAMSIYQQGMSVEETVCLTNAMKNSGDVLSWPELDGPIVDKHSTGGVGDKVSFMLSAIVAACGGYVPMISGPGLGHTGGTTDKLESIAGFNVRPSLSEFRELVSENGVAIISQTKNLAPADKRLYGIRDITATVDSIALITASILSKKLSAGLDALVMDIKVGNGAMMTDIHQANALAQSIVNVATGAGVKTQAIITDMNQVLGNSAGNALEIIETVDYLTGKYREPRLHKITLALASAMLINAHLADNESSALAKIEQVLNSGKAAQVFAKMVAAMGGPLDLLEQPWRSLTKANVTQDIIATKMGIITGMQTRDIGMAVVGLGGGRLASDQQIDHSVGFDKIMPVGLKVKAGDVVARVHASDSQSAERAAKAYLSALRLEDKAPQLTPVIYHSVTATT